MKSAFILIYLFSIFLLACNNSANEDEAYERLSLEQDSDFLKDNDLDGDGIPDKIMFEYTGGVHCCYKLTLELSSDSVQHIFPFHIDGGYVSGVPDNSLPQHFNIVDYDNDGRDEIFVEIETYNGELNQLPKEWESLYGISFHTIVIEFTDSLRIINVPKHISIEQFYHQCKQVSSFSEMIPFKVGDKLNGYQFGFKNENGETIILPILESVTPFSNAAAIVTLNRHPMMINRQGKIINSLEDLHLIDEQMNNDWPILVADRLMNDRFYIGKEGNILNEIPYIDAKSFSEGVAAVQISNEKWGYIDVNNEWLITPQFKHAYPFENDKALVELEDTMLWIDKNGKILP